MSARGRCIHSLPLPRAAGTASGLTIHSRPEEACAYRSMAPPFPATTARETYTTMTPLLGATRKKSSFRMTGSHPRQPAAPMRKPHRHGESGGRASSAPALCRTKTNVAAPSSSLSLLTRCFSSSSACQILSMLVTPPPPPAPHPSPDGGRPSKPGRTVRLSPSLPPALWFRRAERGKGQKDGGRPSATRTAGAAARGRAQQSPADARGGAATRSLRCSRGAVRLCIHAC